MRNDGHQIALDNIGQRLQALYGSAGHMKVTRPRGGYRIELSYPPQEVA
jgi:LytS/YehU family sensor histidine kinase